MNTSQKLRFFFFFFVSKPTESDNVAEDLTNNLFESTIMFY